MQIEELIAQLQELQKKLPRAKVLVVERAYGTTRLHQALNVFDGAGCTICTSVPLHDDESSVIVDVW